jgi:hypothetical protein
MLGSPRAKRRKSAGACWKRYFKDWSKESMGGREGGYRRGGC